MVDVLRSLETLFERNVTHLPAGNLLHEYKHENVFSWEQNLDHAAITRQMQNYWHWTVYIGIGYLLTARWLVGVMADRKPINLRTILFLWNFGLAVFSIMGAYRTTEEFYDTLFNHGFYKSCCFGFDPSSVAAHWFLFFAISKIVELGDTIFLILRKRPLSVLHCWHHFSVMIYTFHSGAEYLAAGRWFMWMNFIAHSVMYTYFAITSLGIRVPRHIAQCVTIVQIAQMVVGVSIGLSVLVLKNYYKYPCQQTDANLYLSFVIYVSYMILFINFFINAYCQKRPISTAPSKRTDKKLKSK
uniref:Elongation of very long chain fatty acids protein n=1 Tax=Panagrellus redivivus TaxID=6233 RepID=A0A7E4UZS2_PANRE